MKWDNEPALTSLVWIMEQFTSDEGRVTDDSFQGMIEEKWRVSRSAKTEKQHMSH